MTRQERRVIHWFAQYQCGCSDDAPLRRELLDYCGKHGSNRTELFKAPLLSRSTQRRRGK